MAIKNSSYYRILRFSTLSLISALVILGVIVVSMSSSYFKKTRLNSLKKTGNMFISTVKDEYRKSGTIISEPVVKLQKIFCTTGGVDIFLYDSTGKCLIDKDGNINPDISMKRTLKRSIDSEDYLDLDSKNISENEPMLLYGSSFRVNRQDEPAVKGGKLYILVYGDTDEISTYTIRMTIFYSVMAVPVAYAVYLLLRRKVRKYAVYESDFCKISEMYSKGDFSEKISTDIPGTLSEIATFVNALASNVETSEETSKTFIANVSHELRTPITTVGGFVDGMLDGTIPKEKRREYLVIVSKEMRRLKILITSMLNMTKFESGIMTPNFKEANITDLVIQTVLMFEKRIEEKNLDVFGLDSERLNVVIDVDLMQQVIYNLVENAVKFVNKDGSLTFRFDKTEEWYEIGIKNTGEGLKEDEIPQVFDRFYKTDSSRGKDTTGLGLGLSISRKIVHLHKGHIVVKSVYGEYTEFIIQLPLEKK